MCVEASCRRKPSGVVFCGGVFFTTEATEGHGETQGVGGGGLATTNDTNQTNECDGIWGDVLNHERHERHEMEG